MSYKARLFRFTRTASVNDLRADALTLELQRIKRKAVSYMIAQRNYGRASFLQGA